MRKIPTDIRELIIKLFYKGKDSTSIAERADVCIATVCRIVNQLELIPSEPDPIICSRFGCGKALTITEQLYGSRCQNHQEEIKLTKEINKVI